MSELRGHRGATRLTSDYTNLVSLAVPGRREDGWREERKERKEGPAIKQKERSHS